MTRTQFAEKASELIGVPALWAAKGDYYVAADGSVVHLEKGQLAVDCSGSVTWTMLQLTGVDFRNEYNAQKLSHLCPLHVEPPDVGDLGFYGPNWDSVNHVVICLAGSHLLSADGATSAIRSLAPALADPWRKVRLHSSVLYRRDEPFLGWCRNSFIESGENNG